jgi:uncharacterized protein (DUF1778 family)
MTVPELVERFVSRMYAETKTGRLQIRLYPEQEAALAQAASLEGHGRDVSSYARKVLDDHVRSVLSRA